MPKFNEPIMIADGMRTAIGSPFRSLKGLTVAQLSAAVLEGLLARAKVKPEQIREVILGNTVSAGTGQNFARQAVYLAGLPITTPAYSVNHVCGSGLQAVIIAVQAMLVDGSGLMIAGGAESASQTPNLVSKDENVELKNKSPVDSLIYDGLWCLMSGRHMGELCEATAAEYKVSRDVQDAYALSSHQKAVAAVMQGAFEREIAPVSVSKTKTFLMDERPRKSLRLEQLAEVPAAFREGGTITAGNASVPSDGAAAVLMGTAAAVRQNGLSPLARITGYVSLAIEPDRVFLAGIGAIRDCCRECGWTLDQVDLFEVSEAFSAQALITREQLRIPAEKFNVCGGDVALGHPLGAAGARSLVTLVHALRRTKKKNGIVCVCLGGGGAIALAVEAV